jgi:hypothetical protein
MVSAMTGFPDPVSEPCPGCGLAYPQGGVPTHAYFGASPGCWARYGVLLAREYADAALMRWHRLTVDAYAAQHPGVPGRRSAQSVHVHLVGLCLALEHGTEPAAIATAMQRMADGRTHAWLEPPALATAVGLPEVIEAVEGPGYGDTVRAWAEAVWQAWSPHHSTIRAEAEAALPSH